MAIINREPEREERIDLQIIVDACNEEEIAMGWYYYLSDNLHFPFDAQWLDGKESQGRSVKVVDMSEEDDCQDDMFVEIEYEEDVFSARLSDIQPLNVDSQTKEAISDWHYWVARGYEF